MEFMKKLNETTQETGQSIADLFSYMDKDGSQEVDFKEFRGLFEEDLTIKLDFNSIQSLFDDIDNDGSGHISYQEFINYFNKANMEFQRIERKQFLQKRT